MIMACRTAVLRGWGGVPLGPHASAPRPREQVAASCELCFSVYKAWGCLLLYSSAVVEVIRDDMRDRACA